MRIEDSNFFVGHRRQFAIGTDLEERGAVLFAFEDINGGDSKGQVQLVKQDRHFDWVRGGVEGGVL